MRLLDLGIKLLSSTSSKTSAGGNLNPKAGSLSVDVTNMRTLPRVIFPPLPAEDQIKQV